MPEQEDHDWTELLNGAAALATMLRGAERAELVFRGISAGLERFSQLSTSIDSAKANLTELEGQYQHKLTELDTSLSATKSSLENGIRQKQDELGQLTTQVRDKQKELAGLEEEYDRKVARLEPVYQTAKTAHDERLALLWEEENTAKVRLASVKSELKRLRQSLPITE